MVGYIYVLDADHFGLSDANGRLIINNIPAGDYKLQLQHPKLGVAPQDQKLTLNANQTHTQTIKLTGFTQVKKEDPGSLNNLFK
ncbi:MAG: hypothetical protein EOO07_37855 [Chitinophagaceae bacterium]|nr:MAG: hypothetical protein EOO07_37855 [Chitinophagaceae bacterium]